MKNYLKINHEDRALVMDRTFAKNASIGVHAALHPYRCL